MAQMRPAPKGYKWIFCKSYRHKCGKVLLAENYGKEAFCFLVPCK